MKTSTQPKEILIGPLPADLTVVETYVNSLQLDPSGTSYFELGSAPPGEDVAWVRTREPAMQYFLRTAVENHHRVKIWFGAPHTTGPDGRFTGTAHRAQLFVNESSSFID